MAGEQYDSLKPYQRRKLVHDEMVYAIRRLADPYAEIIAILADIRNTAREFAESEMRWREINPQKEPK